MRRPGRSCSARWCRGCGRGRAEINRAGAERISRAALHVARQIGRRLSISGGGVQSGHSALRLTCLRPDPFEARPADADAVAERAAVRLHEV